MNFKFDQPLVLKSGPEELKVTKLADGVTTIELADGRIIRVTLRIDKVLANGDDLSISYSTLTDVLAKPEFPVADAPEMIQ